MHRLALERLGQLAARVMFVERNFRASDWLDGLGVYDAIITHQSVHELRHKRYAQNLHRQVKSLLTPERIYLVCDHYAVRRRHVRQRPVHVG